MPPKDLDLEDNVEIIFYVKKIIDNPFSAKVKHQVNGNIVKMLVISVNGVQRLITLDTSSSQDYTVNDLLDSVNIPFTNDLYISLMESNQLNINYVVEVKKREDYSKNRHSYRPRSPEF